MPIDPRLLRIGIEVNGRIQYFSDLNIEASGTKYGNSLQGECDIKITNLSKSVRDFILTETSPLNISRLPKRVILEAGRMSTGLSTVFIGDVIKSTPSQPPDIELSMKAQTLNTSKGDIVQNQFGDMANLNVISQSVASSLGLTLIFQATDKKIANYSFTGGKLKQVEELGKAGGVNVFVDDDRLIVKNKRRPLVGISQTLNKESGMIGVPEITEFGVRVKYLYNNISRVGGGLVVDSEINPAANGNYEIYKLSFSLTNRQNDFYLIAECRSI